MGNWGGERVKGKGEGEGKFLIHIGTPAFYKVLWRSDRYTAQIVVSSVLCTLGTEKRCPD